MSYRVERDKRFIIDAVRKKSKYCCTVCVYIAEFLGLPFSEIWMLWNLNALWFECSGILCKVL